jgi:hypothetical protein
MANKSPFGRETRLRVLNEYFSQSGAVTAENSWEHVYRCLLWIDEGTRLAHIYDSNHMQMGGNFHQRAVRFTDALCERWSVTRRDLPNRLDYLFSGCVAEWRRQAARKKKNDLFDVENDGGDPEDDETQAVERELESDLVATIAAMLGSSGLQGEAANRLAKKIELASRDFFTIGNKRKNALGEGFEDLLFLLLQRVSNIPPDRIKLRGPASSLPGFRRATPRRKGARAEREPHPDIAIFEGEITHIVTTAKWSMRQDRETQFASEFQAYRLNKMQPTELRFALITNEFDIARLNNVASASPTGDGGYTFHNIYHINLDLLKATHGDGLGAVRNWIELGKIRSLADFLNEMRGRFGAAQ